MHFIALAILVLLYMGTLFLAILYLAAPLFAQVPYVPIRKEVLGHIFAALELDDASTLYDLGSGDGRVLIYSAERKPGAKYIGIEKAPYPFIMATFKLFRCKLFKKTETNVVLLRKDFLSQDLSEATHVFTYLFPDAMNALLPKLQRELRPGTRLVSCDFEFSGKKPMQVMDLHRAEDQLARRLLIYQF